jgi:SHS2 domain-containing protein
MDKKPPLAKMPVGTPAAPERERTTFGSVEFRPHPTELGVELRGHSSQDLFRLAAWALAKVQVREWPPEPDTAEGEVELEADGWDDLLVNWMNQLLFLSERDRVMWTEVEFRRLEETGLTARIKGRAWPEGPEAMGRDVKAASYVGLELVPGPSLWLARVTLEL